MIRLLMAGLMVLMAGNANAYTNQDLYSLCKKFADSGFNTSTTEALICAGYFIGIRDAFGSMCTLYKSRYGTLGDGEKIVFEKFALKANPKTMTASVQHYVNKMEQTPENWQFHASKDVADSLRVISPCQPE